MSKLGVLVALSLPMFWGCAVTPPQFYGAGRAESKSITFPKVGQKAQVTAGGIVHLRTNYSSLFSRRLASVLSLERTMIFHDVRVTPAEPLYAATLEGKEVYCTKINVSYDVFGRAFEPACFRETEPGKFGEIMVVRSPHVFTKSIVPPASFSSVEQPIRISSLPLKRELVFDGAEEGILFFTERQYEANLETPGKFKPAVAKVGQLPATVIVNGVSLNILEFSGGSLTYSVAVPWE